MPNFGEFIFGRKDKAKKMSNFTPEQEQFFSQLFGGFGGEGPFASLFGEFDPQNATDTFQKAVSDPAMMNFRQQVIPQIMQGFADQGASSGLNQTLATSGRDLENNLSSQLAQFVYNSQLQHNQNRMGGINQILGTKAFSPYVKQGSSGALYSMLEQFANGAGKALGSFGG